jgi:uncharacterized protein (TIGR00375 family)
MRIISDLHIHSPYSRATSKGITISNLEKFAKIKGVHLLGTGDFTHPIWLDILKSNLREDGSGILRTESGFPFLLSTEISNIYTQDNKGRRIHNVVLAKDFETVDQINSWLSSRGRLDYDGRPILGIPCPEFVEKLMGISKDIMVIPAHVWTPWFSVFGSKSGFDSLGDCYQDQTKHIYAIETGLSSDPPMNWRLSGLDKYSLVSFSDSHSMWPWRIGREATIFDLEKLTFDNMMKALKTREGLEGTVEFFPEEGKYHYDGHRDCGVSMGPKRSMEEKGICPVCKKPMTIGVLHRVEELADRPEGFVPNNPKKFHSLVPLSEIIAFVLKSQPFSSKVWEVYNILTEKFGSEFSILLGAGEEDLRGIADDKIVNLILGIRNKAVKMEPGYDGVYGKISSGKIELRKTGPQRTLGDY